MRSVPGGEGPGDAASPRSSPLLGSTVNWHRARVDRFQEDCERPAASDASALLPSLAGDPSPGLLCRDGFSAPGEPGCLRGEAERVPQSPPSGSAFQERGNFCSRGCPAMSQSDPDGHGMLPAFSSPLCVVYPSQGCVSLPPCQSLMVPISHFQHRAVDFNPPSPLAIRREGNMPFFSFFFF